MLGMPFDAWVLLFFGVGLGLTLEVTFFRARRRSRADDHTAAGDGAAAASREGGGPE